MMKSVNPRSWKPIQLTDSDLLRRLLMGLVLVIIVATIAVLVLDLRKQISKLASSAADNMQWTLGQAEVELLSLEVAALRSVQGKLRLDEVRLRYDIFYSRVTTLTESHQFQQFLATDNIADEVTAMKDFRQAWEDIIDGPDDVLEMSLQRLADEATAVRGAVRTATLNGIVYFSQQGDAKRASLSQSLVRIGLLTVFLVGLLAILTQVLSRLVRRSVAEAKANRETRERIETILSASLDAVVVSDGNGRIVDFNGAAERIFGCPRSKAVGQDMADLIIPEHYRAAHRNGMRRFRRGGSRRLIGKGIVQLDARRSDGTVFPVDLSLDRAQSPDGELFIAFLRDISDRVRSDAALKRARDRAIAGEKQKAEFLAVMSHEMRTPLNGMLGTLELIDPQVLDERDKRYLQIARNSGDVLLGHVNDVLDIAQLDAGKMRTRKERFDLVELLEAIIDNQKSSAHAQGNELYLIPPNPSLHAVSSDPDRLRQVLMNFVGNAIKFTRNGRITIEADCTNGLDAVDIRVTDTGIGIAEADLDRVFEDFVTIDSSYGRNSSGTGLGLGICQRLAAGMGGELGAESEPGDGSIFWLRLSMAPPQHQPSKPADIARPETRPSLASLDILLVEDNEINRIVARDMLERDKHVVREAASGECALEIATLKKFDVILLDISMPGMDGLEVAQNLRRDNGLNAHTPIVATTAHALPQEKQAFYASGMQGVLIKPLTTASIRGALTEAIVEPRAAQSAETASGGPLLDAAHLADMRREMSVERFWQIRQTLVNEMTAFVSSLPSRIQDSDCTLEELSAEAHRMAGSAGVIGAQQLMSQLREIQTEAVIGDLDLLALRVGPLGHCWTATLAILNSLTAPRVHDRPRPRPTEDRQSGHRSS
jgi:PAS domain S-box-containing protein